MTTTYKKDVSDEEVKQAMVVHINEMFKHVQPRVVVQLKPDRDEAGSKKGSGKVGGLISRDEKELLEDVFECPDLGVKARSDRLGWSDYQMNKVKRLVMERGLAESYKINLGSIRPDIGLKLDGELVAVEVEISTKNAVQNIVNDLEAGFDRYKAFGHE